MLPADSDQQTLLTPLEHIGQVTLKPLDLSRIESITLNADARQGSIGVEMLTERGLRIKDFTKEDALPITGDALDHPVVWREKSLADLGEGLFILRVHLERATAYAIDLLQH